jgi:hypothetical protein
MWPEFRALWLQLQGIGNGPLVGGGYGLFLKQHWLSSHQDRITAVRFGEWRDPAPRVTKDVDLVFGLDIISSRDAQARVSQAFRDCDFKVKDPRWQFEKRIGERDMVVDLHSPLPDSADQNLALDKLRVKHKPSLGDAGVHGRQNPEAAGSDCHPFRFEIDDLAVGVPNPVTWSVMKLTATRDRWQKAEDHGLEEMHRNFHRQQALKHAQDVCRVVAMVTPGERDRAAEVIAVIRASAGFSEAAEVSERFFQAEDGWGIRAVARAWRDDDLRTIQGLLKIWFS